MKTLGGSLLLILFLFLHVTLGCSGGSDSKLVGTWEGSDSTSSGKMTFNPDNTFSMESANPTDPRANMKGTGTYTFEGEKLTLIMTDMELGGKSAKDDPRMKAGLGKPLNVTITFKSDTEIEFKSEQGASQTLKKRA